MKPAVILTSDFVVHTDKSYSNYVSYIGRDRATGKKVEEVDYEVDKESFDKYLDYMNRPSAKYTTKKEKGNGLFTNNKNELNSKEQNEIKKKFKNSQENGALLWRDVYSFDNEWLEKMDYLNNGILDEDSIKEASRRAMDECFEREDMKEKGYWVAEIHYNTDNIHVHIASSETENTRPMIEYERKMKDGSKEKVIEPKGKRSIKTEDRMKSTFINHLADRDNSLERLSQLRYDLHHSINIDRKSTSQKKRLEEIKKMLPADRRHWSYNHYNMKHLKDPIDRYTNIYMNTYHKDRFQEYRELLMKDKEYNKALYGVGSKNKNRFEDSYNNKVEELNSKMGNALLRTIKESEKKKKKKSRTIEVPSEIFNQLQISKNAKSSSKGNRKIKMQPKNNITKYDLYAVERAFSNHRREHELESQSKQLEQKIQNENQNEL